MEQIDQSSLCEALEELVPAYGLGAADADERAFFEANLVHCPEVAAELAEYAAIKAALHYSTPLVSPPAGLENRLMAAVQAAPTTTTPMLPVPNKWTIRRWDVRTLLTAAAILLFIASNAFWIIRSIQGYDQYQHTEHVSSAEQAQVLAVVGSGRSKLVWLNAVNKSVPLPPSATLTCDPTGKIALLYVKNFPVTPPGKVYQLWMRHDGTPINIGTFKVDTAGTNTLIFSAPLSINTFDSAGITIEPAEGSPQPTGEAIVRGALTY